MKNYKEQSFSFATLFFGSFFCQDQEKTTSSQAQRPTAYSIISQDLDRIARPKNKTSSSW